MDTLESHVCVTAPAVWIYHTGIVSSFHPGLFFSQTSPSSAHSLSALFSSRVAAFSGTSSCRRQRNLSLDRSAVGRPAPFNVKDGFNKEAGVEESTSRAACWRSLRREYSYSWSSPPLPSHTHAIANDKHQTKRNRKHTNETSCKLPLAPRAHSFCTSWSYKRVSQNSQTAAVAHTNHEVFLPNVRVDTLCFWRNARSDVQCAMPQVIVNPRLVLHC